MFCHLFSLSCGFLPYALIFFFKAIILMEFGEEDKVNAAVIFTQKCIRYLYISVHLFKGFLPIVINNKDWWVSWVVHSAGGKDCKGLFGEV